MLDFFYFFFILFLSVLFDILGLLNFWSLLRCNNGKDIQKLYDKYETTFPQSLPRLLSL